jgi:tRNA(fMet)-specific endonuclease VapC
MSYIFRSSPLAIAYEEVLLGYERAVSAVTVGELLYGAERQRWGAAKRESIEKLISAQVVVPATRAIATTYATLLAERERSGRPMTYSDAWIAATAVTHGWPLATHNRRHFEHVPGLDVISFS